VKADEAADVFPGARHHHQGASAAVMQAQNKSMLTFITIS